MLSEAEISGFEQACFAVADSAVLPDFAAVGRQFLLARGFERGLAADLATSLARLFDADRDRADRAVDAVLECTFPPFGLDIKCFLQAEPPGLGLGRRRRRRSTR